ncbi:AI-2E family transporter [Thermococcus stetteri]|uniref:AI-2E family transporter n=1 Tax=Thermococcus stetteri TaxID=49900 RepID=UPI001AE46982|nr:AI-2E family transporter [Thermococcus stetteri]MBP1912297.1 putative PurR-regulated permease PerM [Thermococcus stetteri]
MRVETAVWAAVSIGALYLTWETVSPILSPIIIAATTAYILYPIHERLERKIGGRWSALTLTGILTVISLLFVFGFALLINDVKYSLANYVDTFVDWLLGLNLPPSAYEVIQKISLGISQRFNSYVLGYTYSLPTLILQVVVMVFSFYGILVNASTIKREVYSLIPPSNRNLARELIDSGAETLNIVLRGWLLIGVGKGMVLALLFRAFGVSDVGGAVAAGILTVIIELLPVVGGWIVWVGGVAYLANQGQVLPAVLLTVLGFSLVSPLPDILLKEKISRVKWGVDAIISLLGFIGGYIAFGFVGIIIGPVSLGLLKTLIEEWKEIKERSP